jgi:hypothetical protein
MPVTSQQTREMIILVSALAGNVFAPKDANTLASKLATNAEIAATTLTVAKNFEQPRLTRALKLAKPGEINNSSLQLDFRGTQISYQNQVIGASKILFKTSYPGELQARLAVESAIERFLDFLKKKYYIAVLDESDRHVLLFIPNTSELENVGFESLWNDFVTNVLFSSHGLPRLQLPGLMQSFVAMLKSVTLAGKGFSILEVPIITRDQANVLAAWYFAVWREAKKRQDDRRQKIKSLSINTENTSLSEKELKAVSKQLQDAEDMQVKEDKKYQENFHVFFKELIEEQKKAYGTIADIDTRIKNTESKSELNKLIKQKNKLTSEIIFSQTFLEYQSSLYEQSKGNPFILIEQDYHANPQKFREIKKIADSFNKTATDQIAGVKGDIFAKCIIEMYRLMEMADAQIDSLIDSLLTESPFSQIRSPGDDSKEFCYSCGTKLDSKAAEWQVRRLVFESPEQRRQSATGKGRPHICKSCSALAFASPLKLTGESIIVKLEASSGSQSTKLKLQDYLRMLASKELHLSAGKYIILASEKTQGGDSASQKLGQVQYALAKLADTFPVEVLIDFHFSLMTQGAEAIRLENRRLIFIKGLMECYGHKILISGQDINLVLGDSIRYLQQDLPYLAEYVVAKAATFSKGLEMEQIRTLYWNAIQTHLKFKGDVMDSETQLAKRARLFRDVAALTGLTLAFASSLESTAKKLSMDKDDIEREISKLIEKVEDPVAFCYYATLGDEKKTKMEARLWLNADNTFIYGQTKNLLTELEIPAREEEGEDGKTWLVLYADDILRAYTYFSEKKDYCQEKDWKELTYQVRLSLYTRFPELVRKPKKGDK